jgi:heme o synthase
MASLATTAPAPHALRRRKTADFWTLTKPEINLLIVIATAAGFYLGQPSQHLSQPGGFPLVLLINTLVGTLLVASGAGALNQYVERRFDAEMRRTRRRPLVDKRLEPQEALRFGILVASAGSIYLGVTVNALSSLLAVLTLASYLALYTPLKRRTSFCTLVGAFSGAMPPLIGWAAATNSLGPEAWMLYCILFLWQFPHFMAIAWMYREDYARAGYSVLPKGPQAGRFMSWQAMVPSLVLLPFSAGTAVLAGLGRIGVLAVCALTSALVFCSARLAFRRSNVEARRLLTVSIIYLPLTYFVLMLGAR